MSMSMSMPSSSSLSFPTTMPLPAAAGLGQQHGLRLPRRSTATVRCRSCGGRDGHGQYGGALVDEGMAVLRRRIREARMAERNYEAPEGWAAWERRYYPAYVSDVAALAGALQRLLMDTRPTVVAAAAALLLAGVPVSALAALHHLAQAAESVLHHVS